MAAAGDQEAELPAAGDPDVASPADLVRRMELVALAQGIDLGQIRAVSGWAAGAEISADRDKVAVVLRPGEGFLVRICLPGVLAWSEGWTDDLAAVVGVADLWRRGGRLRELHDRFPFMSWSELNQAFEDGDPAPTKWRQLLSSEWHLRDRPFLQAAHAHPELRMFYPDISHRSLMLSRNPFDPASDLAKITPLSEGHYRVVGGAVEFRREVTSLTEALEVTAACFRSLPDS
ncbi:DUF6193 family natural product biosynthesis protein [Streptomyces fulvoviolaceus]|uniref:DUF6193 family natural product biosynthesis protein n=1 Tax=Streptomyces fulvoviolaceus TaxID=285535 RepID=UPI00131E372B|nr:DUF6193 family natural product biosynthesis protein [Streptomyces fulvoviolaceus]